MHIFVCYLKGQEELRLLILIFIYNYATCHKCDKKKNPLQNILKFYQKFQVPFKFLNSILVLSYLLFHSFTSAIKSLIFAASFSFSAHNSSFLFESSLISSNKPVASF